LICIVFYLFVLYCLDLQ